MSLEHAILGFLNYAALSGYDLKKAFDASVRHFWPADQSQIYRSLARLAEQDLAEVEVVEQQDRPDRKVYHITAAGRAELRRWLAAPLPPHEPRSAPLIQVFFAGQLSDQEILTVLERAAVETRQVLAQYAQIPQNAQSYAQHVGSPREAFFWMLTLEYGTLAMQAQLEWIESAIQRIKNKQYPS